jgi:hypothetical protein
VLWNDQNLYLIICTQELQEFKEAHDDQPDDLSLLQETVEMATLDKEMAEEKVVN